MAETIFALATPPGRSGLAVVRISGAGALGAAAALGADRLPPRRATLRRLADPRDGAPLDRALILRFAAPASFTGEDVVELHIHGGMAVWRSVAAALAALPGLRAAEAGEFTRRALMNGRLDLAQVEGIGDLLAAETAAQARQALALVDGALSARAAEWREGLVRAAALVEASIDFADEALSPDALGAVEEVLAGLERAFERELAGASASERLRHGFEVALVGAPNCGKSTLLNALAGREAAIVSEIAGTTRDAIEVRLDLDGLAVTFVDMAGLRSATESIERIGVERARDRAARADLRLFLVDGEADVPALGVARARGDVVALAKGDLRRERDVRAVSGRTGDGVPELLARVAGELVERSAGAQLINRERHRVALDRARAAVAEARAAVTAGDRPELAAAEIGIALRALDFLVGKVDVEAVLGEVFARFCIGK